MSSSRKSQHSCQRLRVKTSKCCVEQKFISGTRNYIPSCIDSSAEEINDQEAIFKSNNGWISDNQKCNFLTTFCLVFWIWLKLYFGYEVLQFSRSIICVKMFRIKEWIVWIWHNMWFCLRVGNPPFRHRHHAWSPTRTPRISTWSLHRSPRSHRPRGRQ